MAFSKIILSQAVSVAKKSSKLQSSVDDLKNKLISETESKIQENIPVPLPFSLRDAINGNVNLTASPTDLLQEIPEISEPLKVQANETLDTLEENLNNVIKKKNNLQSGINTLTLPLNTINVLGNTLGTITSSLNTVITVIKALPIPVAVPPAPGLPLNVIINYGDGLAKAKDAVGLIDGAVSIIPTTTNQVRGLLGVINTSLSALDEIFIPTTTLISFLRTFINFGPNATQEQFEETLNTAISNTVNSLPLTGLSSDSDTNSNVDGDLEKRLQPNSTNPIWHRGYRLVLQYDDKNKFSFPSRRIKGTNTNIDVNPIIYHLEDNSYSYSSSLQVMVDEIKNRIDTSLAIPLPPVTTEIPEIEIPPNYSPFSSAGNFEGEIKKLGNLYYQFSSDSLWSEYQPDTTPFNGIGKYNGEQKLYKKSPLVFIPYKWVENLGGSINTQTLKWVKQI